MNAAENAEKYVARQEEHRTVSRYGVDEDAHLLLVKQSSIVPCRILDLSLDGCRLYSPERLPVESMMCVEVNFKVKGLPFRFSGLVQWTDCQHLAGIRFANVPRRRRGELVETLSEIRAETVAMGAGGISKKQTVERHAEPVMREQPAAPKPVMAVNQPGQEAQSPVQAAPAMTAQMQTPASAKPIKRERRQAFRETVDTSAVIDLIKMASRLQGRILDLSLSGCRIRTDEAFPVGIYTRIEVEFHLDGLPFRLGGVIQDLHDRRTVGIRFLDLSSRKRDQVEQLIEEIREKKEAENRE